MFMTPQRTPSEVGTEQVDFSETRVGNFDNALEDQSAF
jgi:hypothetical protein